MVVPPMWDDARDFLDSVIPQFRTDPWAGAKTLVLVFSEKMGMTPILSEVTERYGVPLFPTIGYTSETFVWDAAQLVKRAGKPAVVLQVGDHDNSGLDMMRAAEERLREMVAPLPVTLRARRRAARAHRRVRPADATAEGRQARRHRRRRGGRDRRHGPGRRAGASEAGTAALPAG